MLEILRRHVPNGDDRSTDLGESDRGKPVSIGLGLSGGAARGFAHIGVIRTLVQNGIKPDVITGTSIGAIAAACYAAGHLNEFETWARHLTRRRVFGYLDFSLAGSGLIGGGRLVAQLDKILGHITFPELPIRVAGVATEIRTNHEIWLTRGRVSDAVRASGALPGIFPRLRIGAAPGRDTHGVALARRGYAAVSSAGTGPGELRRCYISRKPMVGCGAPISGLPEIGIIKCAGRVNPTCVRLTHPTDIRPCGCNPSA